MFCYDFKKKKKNVLQKLTLVENELLPLKSLWNLGNLLFIYNIIINIKYVC